MSGFNIRRQYEYLPAEMQREYNEKNLDFQARKIVHAKQGLRVFQEEFSRVQVLQSSNLYNRLKVNGEFENKDSFMALAREYSETFSDLELEQEDLAALIAILARLDAMQEREAS